MGRLAPAFEALAGPLRQVFDGFAFNVSDRTVPEVVAAAERHLGARIIRHPASEASIGRVRREAVGLAQPSDWILYSDPDHILRWVNTDPADLERVLSHAPELDLLVIGRSESAMATMPRRLVETERLVNHTFTLLTGHDWDLLFAIRRFNQRGAETIVATSREETLANDVEWPLLAAKAGLSVGYAQSYALAYRTIEEFGASTDTGDASPLQWIRRLEFAALMATTMRRFLPE